jgi:CMD domain protein
MRAPDPDTITVDLRRVRPWGSAASQANPTPNYKRMTEASSTPDVIDQLAGIEAGDLLDAIRGRRPQARIHAQQSYLALFEPAPPLPGDFALTERFAIAAFVAGLHRHVASACFYAQGLARHGADREMLDVVVAAAASGAAQGPFGRFPAGPLSAEDSTGTVHAASEVQRAALGARLCAAFDHAHLLLFHPRDASPAALQRLLDAGWATTDIVTLSQLVAFLSFQIRVVAGLQVLGVRPAMSSSSETRWPS